MLYDYIILRGKKALNAYIILWGTSGRWL